MLLYPVVDNVNKHHLELPKPETRSTFLSSPSASSLLQTSARSWNENWENSNHSTFLTKRQVIKMFTSFWAKARPNKSDVPLWSGQLVASWYSCALWMENGKDKLIISIGPSLCSSTIYFKGSCTYRAAISASCSAALIAASSSSLDKALIPFLSFAYHVRSLPFCQRPTGAIKEFPGNKTEEFRPVVISTSLYNSALTLM